MLKLFTYNWEVRNDWIEWCEGISYEELVKERTGGMKSLLQNLYHVINCEHLWVSHMLGEPVERIEVSTLEEVKAFSKRTKERTLRFLEGYEKEANDVLALTGKDGQERTFPFEQVLYHIITHEVHHIGQVSVWAREMDRKPVRTDLIAREY
ncbi:DinB family protein [Alteribacter aurantiacus]|uniref:DinB family protein n=1 Tax=Alteribacter aurantiacus TaxID=254410 RepID=UPI00047B1632|nr:DinB family protein [Alteribacter aurantiacus]